MDDLLDNGDIDNDVSFGNYIKGGYGGVSLFTFTASLLVLYIALTLFLFLYSGSVTTLIIMGIVTLYNISHTVYHYSFWKRNKKNL